MRKIIFVGISATLYVLALLLICYYFYIEFNENYIMSPEDRVAILVSSCLLMYPGGVLLARQIPRGYRDRLLKMNLAIWMVLYMILLCTLTLFDDYFSRDGFHLVEWNRGKLDNYIADSLN